MKRRGVAPLILIPLILLLIGGATATPILVDTYMGKGITECR